MSRAPNLSRAEATIRLGASSPVMSQPKDTMALFPACACSTFDSGRSKASTRAPSSAKSLAEDAPMPDPAPVTIAILPASLMPRLLYNGPPQRDFPHFPLAVLIHRGRLIGKVRARSKR